jgi:HK97 family phage portal protein
MGKGGYAYIERDRNDVISLRYVEEIYITILKNFKPIYKDYQILVEGEAYYPYDFIKLLRNTKDGASGVGLTVEVSKALETAYQTLLYQLGMVKSGGNKKGFLKSQRKLGQDEIDVLKSAWRRLYANNEENVVVLNNGLEFQEASNSSVEMQLNESKKTLQDEINHLFHISDNFELFFKEAIYPIIKAFETALNRDLLLEKEKKSLFFEFDVKEIIKANITERYNAYKTAKETGFMTLNEIRRMENMNYVEGLDVVNVGLGAVLYDTDTHQYFTPNTGETVDLQKEENMLEGHVMEEEFKESGNSSDA